MSGSPADHALDVNFPNYGSKCNHDHSGFKNNWFPEILSLTYSSYRACNSTFLLEKSHKTRTSIKKFIPGCRDIHRCTQISFGMPSKLSGHVSLGCKRKCFYKGVYITPLCQKHARVFFPREVGKHPRAEGQGRVQTKGSKSKRATAFACDAAIR